MLETRTTKLHCIWHIATICSTSHVDFFFILIQMQAQRTTKDRPRSSSESRRLASHSVATATNRPVEFIADYDRDMEITYTDCNFLYNR